MPPARVPCIRPPLQTTVAPVAHPSGGWGHAYSQEMRQFVLAIRAAGHSDNPLIQEQRQAHTYPSKQTEERWVALEAVTGNALPCRRTGNKRATVLKGQDLFFLTSYRIVFPKCTASEINAFLYRINFGNMGFQFYSPSQISEAEKQLFLTRKRGSTTAYQALLPVNVQKRWNYWNLPYPFSMADILIEDTIDLDECGIFLQTADRHIGKAAIGCRVREAGPYAKTEKYNLLLAISGSQEARRWSMTWLVGGTTNDKMIEFVTIILSDLPHGTPERRYCFTMDNLNSHHNNQLQALIHAHGHRLVYRAPYYAVDGAIEYVFNTLQCELRMRLPYIFDSNDLMHEVGNAITAMPTFRPYFEHIGFWR